MCSKAATAAEQANEWLAANPVEAEWLKEPVKGDFTFHAVGDDLEFEVCFKLFS